MSKLHSAISLMCVASVVVGCAASTQSFIKKSSTMGDVKVCRNYLKDNDELQGREQLPAGEERRIYLDLLASEINTRGLSVSTCTKKVQDENNLIAAGLIVATAVVVVVATDGDGGGGGGYISADDDSSNYAVGESTYTASYGHAWDQFYDANYNLVWRCRDKSNGQFATNTSCYSKAKLDTTWPNK